MLQAVAIPVWGVAAAPLTSWREVIEPAPYWESQGTYANLVTIRRWVLNGAGYCGEPGRHILFDRRMRFLGYLPDAGEREANQRGINELRRRWATEGKIDAWVAGDEARTGYPFVLSCNQPDAHLPNLLARYAGEERSARLWGTWDGMRVGSQAQPVSLHVAIRSVYEQRRAAGRVALPEHVLSVLAGKVIIESGGGMRDAQSRAGAIGIMQLSPAALRDCRLGEPHQLHRMAQIDCALYLLEQNHRNLEPAFNQRFGHLPDAKAEALYRMLLVQAYHSGVGRVRALLVDEALSGPASYFAANAARFTPGDIALGMIFHNLGRRELGFAALYYVADVALATEAACRRVSDLPGCPEA